MRPTIEVEWVRGAVAHAWEKTPEGRHELRTCRLANRTEKRLYRRG